MGKSTSVTRVKIRALTVKYSIFQKWQELLFNNGEKVQNNFFNTLEPLWKSALHHTQLSGTSATVSYCVSPWNQSVANSLKSCQYLRSQRANSSRSNIGGDQDPESQKHKCLESLWGRLAHGKTRRWWNRDSWSQSIIQNNIWTKLRCKYFWEKKL